MSNQVNVNVNGGGGIVPYTYKTVFLKPNFVGKDNMLVQGMVGQNNTKYVIKHDYTLGGKTEGVAHVDTISPFVNPGYAGAYAAWIAADNSYTNVMSDPESTQDEKDAALVAKNAVYEALQANPQYYYYDRKQVVINANQHVSIPDGCVLLNSSGAVVTFENGIALRETIVYVCSLVEGDYEYSLTNAIVMPEGCLVEFDGGSISDGVVVGDDTVLVYHQAIDAVLHNVTLLGGFRISAGFDGDYNSLKNKPVIPAAQVQADWNVDNEKDVRHINNRPTIPVVPQNVATVDSGNSLPESGVEGQMFFYTPDGETAIPIWRHGDGWVDATGSQVTEE